MNYNLIKEFYFPIHGFSKYAVSNFGNVKNIKTGRILKQFNDGRGYLLLKIVDDFGELSKQKTHRLVLKAFSLNIENKECVDHIDNNRLNNKLENLRWATNQENSQNRQISIKNTSGYKGVSFHKRHNKWCAYIKINKKLINLGSYLLKEDAIRARCKKAQELFGEFLNICEKKL